MILKRSYPTLILALLFSASSLATAAAAPDGATRPPNRDATHEALLKYETKSVLLANSVDNRRNCRHIHMLGLGRAHTLGQSAYTLTL
jgi:hypothetical protein